MTMAEETAAHLSRLEERMKTQHAKSITRISNQARHHTSQIARLHDLIANITIDAQKRETRMILIIVGTLLSGLALATTILISMLD